MADAISLRATSEMGCFLARVPNAGPCDGRLIRAHLIPRSLLKREFGKTLGSKLAEDPATWVWACGGALGPGGHHGQLDHSRTLRVPRVMLPRATEDFAAAHGLLWFLDREYGERAVAA